VCHWIQHHRALEYFHWRTVFFNWLQHMLQGGRLPVWPMRGRWPLSMHNERLYVLACTSSMLHNRHAREPISMMLLTHSMPESPWA
jgi:hypothetical protein